MRFRVPKWFDGTTLNIWLFCGIIVGGYTIYEMKTGRFNGKVRNRWEGLQNNTIQDSTHEEEEDDNEVNFDEIDELKRK